jgi:SAM-dependent methyltransferase
MTSVASHYETLLAPVYLWMAGGIEQALVQGASDIAELSGGGFAIDLGAGFGMHSIPLARAGFRVLAIDSSAHLLEQLRAFADGLPVDTAMADLLLFPGFLKRNQRPDAILCMGDTLTHLPDIAGVEQLAQSVASSLAPAGRFIATFRDYTHLPEATRRFIPVRSDAQRILTCFLEEQGDTVRVHDVLHENHGGAWTMRVSSYQKLRLALPAVQAIFERAGLSTSVTPGPRGMIKLVAHRNS